MNALTAVVITYNEESNIEDCLQSLTVADEIIIVDSNSSDKTVELAKKYTEKIFVVDWKGYAAAKNYGIDRSSNDWILSIDADERLSDELVNSIQKLKSQKPSAAGFTIPRRTWYLKRWIKAGGWYPDRNIRLFNRQSGRFKQVPVHEAVNLSGNVIDLDGDILHFSYNNISDHIIRIDKYSSLAALNWYKNGRKPNFLIMLVRPIWEFLRKFVLLRGYKDGKEGLILAGMHAFYVFSKYVKLYELHLSADSD